MKILFSKQYYKVQKYKFYLRRYSKMYLFSVRFLLLLNKVFDIAIVKGGIFSVLLFIFVCFVFFEFGAYVHSMLLSALGEASLHMFVSQL